MSTHLYALIVDSHDIVALAAWWARALGWRIGYQDADEVSLRSPEGTGLWMTFVPVTDPKTVKNRLHVDLASESQVDQDARVAQLLGDGARRADIGQAETPWTVLADPEGNEFCVLEHRPHYSDTGPVAALVIDAVDPAALAGFWAEASGWTPVDLGMPWASLRHPSGTGPFLEFVRAAEPKTGKNRPHLDVAPHPGDDHAAEVERLRALGAVPADVGQGDVSWVVLRDPEGNEFCVLTPRDG